MRELIRSRYKNSYGEPFEASEGQVEIFEIIARRLNPRNHCMCYTQFGKSDIVSQAVLTRVTTFSEKWAIVAPSNKKARIIMGFLIGHIFDNELTTGMFEIDKNESIDRIRRERSKDRITFRFPDGAVSEVFIISAEGKRTKDVLDALLGFGAPNVILDESALIDDPQYAGVFRMLGGHEDNFIFEIGNPMRRNHFLKSSRDSNYYHVNIDCYRGIKEGRIQSSFIEEMRTKPFFEQLYENKFPSADVQDTDGYSNLFTEDFIRSRINKKIDMFGLVRLGADVAGEGSNYSVIVKRSRNGARISYKKHNPDTMNFSTVVVGEVKKEKIPSNKLYIDKVGIGKGIYDRLKEIPETKDVMAVNAGEAPASTDFFNKRAEMFWRMKVWLTTAELEGTFEDWVDLLSIKYKVQSDKKVKIKSKVDMLRDGDESPDVADALSLTFYDYDSEKDNDSYKKYVQPSYESPVQMFPMGEIDLNPMDRIERGSRQSSFEQPSWESPLLSDVGSLDKDINSGKYLHDL